MTFGGEAEECYPILLKDNIKAEYSEPGETVLTIWPIYISPPLLICNIELE